MWRTFFATRTEVTTGDDLRRSINCAPLTFSTGRKHTVWFALKGDDPRPAFAFPGISRRYNGPIRKNGENVALDVYAFLTTTPNPLVATINHERMPVLLAKPEDFDQWLNGTPAEALQLAREYPPHLMRIVHEGFDKEDLLVSA